jgi:tellurite resistance protein TerC
VFAILGLRALYFLLADFMDRFHLLKYGLAVILGFVGLKMLGTAIECGTESMFCQNHHVTVPIWLSLVIIVGTLAATVVLSLKIAPKHDVDPPYEDDNEDRRLA